MSAGANPVKKIAVGLPPALSAVRNPTGDSRAPCLCRLDVFGNPLAFAYQWTRRRRTTLRADDGKAVRALWDTILAAPKPALWPAL